MKVKIHFTLIGKTNQWKKYIKSIGDEPVNSFTLKYVTDLVVDQFGDRAVHILNEKMLKNESVTYPKYFSAKLIVSEEDPRTELTVVAHGETIAMANKAVMDSLKTIEWSKLAVKI